MKDYKWNDSIPAIQEEIEDEGIASDPFDPNAISIDTKPVPMETYLRRLLQGTIKLNPDFQRNEVWTDDKKSQLIESLMLKIPLPMFYVSADEKGNYTVVDGLQRLSTIRSFILGDDYFKTRAEPLRGNGFKLNNLEFWKEFEQKTFNELPANLQNRIIETVFTFTIINPGTPEEVRRNIFKRINTGGVPLSSQEIRNALYTGACSLLLCELSQYSEFIEAIGGPIKSLRMEDREFILRFVAFWVRPYISYRKTISIDNFLSDTMIIVNAMPLLESRELKKAIDREKRIEIKDIFVSNVEMIKEGFKKAMLRSRQLFGKHTFRSSHGDNKKNQLNKGLLETWGVLLSQLTDIEFATLLSKSNIFMMDYIEILKDPKFRSAISKNSMNQISVHYRFETIKQLINKHLQI